MNMNYGKINKDGCLSLREAHEEKAAKLFEDGWKPVDTFDASGIEGGENETVMAIPYDGGEKISFTYEKVIDKAGIQKKIEKLKKEVAETDYQVRKCYEYSIVGKPMPYDIETIHQSSETIRAEINRLELLLR